uniref:Polyprotein n=1 Tax=Peronospora matthiolae TaxID=2874970 RepID=A0AAV1U517_9STRA
MSPTTPDAGDILREDNYFVWEFNARMRLAKKGLLEHLDAMKAPEEGDASASTWKVNDMKAFAIVSTMISTNLQSMVRTAETTAKAWDILKTFFLRQSMHNRVQLRRQLHEFKLAKGGSIMDHFLRFDELCMTMQAVGQEISQDEHLVILLGSLTRDYDPIVKIIENMPGMTLFHAKEMLRREYDGMARTEHQEIALKSTHTSKYKKGPRRHMGRSSSRGEKFSGRCYRCNKYGHKRQDCKAEQVETERSGEERAFTASSRTSAGWLLDSGASSHMCPDRNEFSNLNSLTDPIMITIADGSEVEAQGVGTVRVQLKTGEVIRIEETLWVPGLDRRLLSISALSKRGLQVIFSDLSCQIRSNTEVVAQIPRRNKMYVLECSPAEVANVCGETSQEQESSDGSGAADLQVWHARLGHLSTKMLKGMAGCVNGLKIKKNQGVEDDIEICEGCIMGKATVKTFPKSPYGHVKTKEVLQLVHSDVMGPMESKSRGGSRFVVTFIDDYSRYIVAYYIENKSEVTDRFIEYKALMENQLSKKIKCIRTDNGTEYVNRRFSGVCRKSGIMHQTTVPYSPQQNGLAERMNRTLTERARAMLSHMQVDKIWWAEAMNTAVYVTNRVPCASHPTKTPFEFIFGKKPDLSEMCVFGSKGYAHVDKSNRTKMTKKAIRCIFLGYSDQIKGLRIWDEDAKRVTHTRSAKFDERPPLQYVQRYSRSSDQEFRAVHDEDTVSIDLEQPRVTKDMDIAMEDSHSVQEESHMQDRRTTTMALPSRCSSKMPEHVGSNADDPMFEIDDVTMIEEDQESAEDVSRQGQMVIRPSRQTSIQASQETAMVPLESVQHGQSQALIPVNGADEDFYDGSEVCQEKGTKRLRIGYEQACAAFETPTTYEEALKSPRRDNWYKAIQAELKALEEKDTWTVQTQRPNQKVIGTKWVFALKRNELGEIIRYKARLVALGYRQTYGVDYMETYSPVANLNSIRVFLAVCCQKGMLIHQYDVDTAFLYGVLEEEVYVYPPLGVRAEHNQVLKLNRSLYGLKQAAATWYKTISCMFVEMGFFSCVADSCIFVKETKGSWIYAALYVDDLLIGAESTGVMEDVAAQLSSRFQLKILEGVRYVLGIEVKYLRNNRRLKISQGSCISRMVEKFNQVDAKAVSNPSVEGQAMVKMDKADTRMKNRPYRSLVGSLLYVATGKRPDIAYTVCQLSRHLEFPHEEHWNAAIRVLRYLKTTQSKGICYEGVSGNLQLSAYTDADWASNKWNRRSISGVFIMINGAPVIFKSKMQQSVALSTAEAEYMALSLCVQEVLWTRSLLKEMQVQINYAVKIHEDNQSAIAIAKNDGYQSRAKHIDIRYHFVREQVKDKIIDLQYTETKSQLADFLTKPISTKKFESLLDKAKIRDF